MFDVLDICLVDDLGIWWISTSEIKFLRNQTITATASPTKTLVIIDRIVT